MIWHLFHICKLQCSGKHTRWTTELNARIKSKQKDEKIGEKKFTRTTNAKTKMQFI